MVDTVAATELVLSVDNDGELYRSMKRPIIENMCRKIAAGKYDHGLAVKAWLHLAEAGAKWYAKEYATPGEWSRIFPPTTRREAAIMWRDAFEIEYACNQYDGINPVPAGKRRALQPDPNYSRRES